jgi:hypothetical protein
MDVNAIATALAELERVSYAQGISIRQLHERLNAANEALVILEARLTLITSALDRWANRWETLAA